MRKNGYAKYKEDARRKEDSFCVFFYCIKSRKEEHEVSIVANIMLWIFPTLLALALVVGIVVFIVVRRREMRRRAEFHRAQAARERSQEKELEKMKIDDL